MSDVLIDATDLMRALERGERPRLLDVRWRLGRTGDRSRYEAGHLPGAVHVDLERELAAHGLPASEGRHPLPTADELERAARGWGLHDGDAVVVYDDLGGQSASRLWWALKWGGMRDVRILDGGIDAWTRAGGALGTGAVAPEPGDVRLVGDGMPVLTIDDAAGFPERGLLIDARAAERYRGEVEPIDPVAGHIPGAVSGPTVDNLDDDGRFLPADDLVARFAALGAAPGAPVGVYCGSGITAAHGVAALAIAGIDAALFPGSWSAWSNSPGRPVATGAAP